MLSEADEKAWLDLWGTDFTDWRLIWLWPAPQTNKTLCVRGAELLYQFASSCIGRWTHKGYDFYLHLMMNARVRCWRLVLTEHMVKLLITS